MDRSIKVFDSRQAHRIPGKPASNLEEAKARNTISYYFIVNLKQIKSLTHFTPTEKKRGKRRAGPIE
jgi:hypothetical protein